MAEDISDKLNEGKLDLVPMIDCIMLLLLFFILTTKFTAPEKAIDSLLPTDKGQLNMATPKTEPPHNVNITIYPEGMTVGLQPSGYLAKLKELQEQYGDILPNAMLRIGGDEAMLLDGHTLGLKDDPRLTQTMSGIQQYVFQKLQARENPKAATRKDQDPITISCFSGLSWKFALVVYDAVRAYEATKTTGIDPSDPKTWALGREIDFAPPRIRNYDTKALGEELFEILRMQ
jgi:biopolymer transport protein ExbD